MQIDFDVFLQILKKKTKPIRPITPSKNFFCIVSAAWLHFTWSIYCASKSEKRVDNQYLHVQTKTLPMFFSENFLDSFFKCIVSWLCGKCIVRQSSAKFDKVDMFSKQAIKKQSWQSWCIFLSIFKNIMQSKVGKVEMWIHYSRQSWQSSDFYISNNGQSS